MHSSETRRGTRDDHRIAIAADGYALAVCALDLQRPTAAMRFWPGACGNGIGAATVIAHAILTTPLGVARRNRLAASDRLGLVVAVSPNAVRACGRTRTS